jgi:hypothetical protein
MLAAFWPLSSLATWIVVIAWIAFSVIVGIVVGTAFDRMGRS